MEGGLFRVEELRMLLEGLSSLGELMFDLGGLVGDSGSGPKVEVNELLGFISPLSHSQIALHWDDKVLAVSHTNGVLATFELKF